MRRTRINIKEQEHFKMLKFIDHRANKAGNVEIVASGIENIPKKTDLFLPKSSGHVRCAGDHEVAPVRFLLLQRKKSQIFHF